MFSKYLKALSTTPSGLLTQLSFITYPSHQPLPPPLTRLMSVSYCKAEPELAVTTLARRNIPCSSSSFLIPRTWESKVCKSRSWRYLSFDPQMKSRSLRTCRRTNGVCWIIRYLRGNTTQSLIMELYTMRVRGPQRQAQPMCPLLLWHHPLHLPLRESKTRNDQRQEVGFENWCQRSSLFGMEASGPSLLEAECRPQTHQQHDPGRRIFA